MRLTARRGDAGSHVIELQRLLVDDNVSPGPADGVFGPATEAAVRVFQKRHGLTVDGVCGPVTWRALLGDGGRVQLSDLPAGLTWGLDVSSAGQDRPLPWRELYEAGARFAWVRVCVGSTVDRWAERHARGARDAGLLVGAYGVPRSRDRRTAWHEGNGFAIETARVGAVDLPAAIDLELPDVEQLSRASVAEVLSVLAGAGDYCDGAEAALQRQCAVYSGPAWLATAAQRGGEAARAALVRLAGAGAERPLWLAQYPLRDVQAGQWPAVPAPWSAVSCWQVAGDKGAEALRVDGRRVDLDLWRGSVEELRALGR